MSKHTDLDCRRQLFRRQCQGCGPDQAPEGSLENEFFCLRLAARLKLPVPDVQMRLQGAISFLLLERYDRSRHDDGCGRTHHLAAVRNDRVALGPP
ncbi:HipA domain-containing protein [Bradyrhizobium sp. NBAIM01]|nr:HipA domain-containing protein [Bradyrhizobium sp. NBAIM01]